jgi:ribosome recycling factor
MATATHDLAELKRRMQGAIHVLKGELGGLRTGRASPSLLEPVHVEAYGTHMPLNQLATISVPEPRLLTVQVWDKSMVSAVERAIINANLGLNPATEGQVLRLRVPELNEERRRDLVKVVHNVAEEGRVAVRNIRRDVMGDLRELKKDGEIGEDDERRAETELHRGNDEAITEIEELLKGKEEEILEV